MKSLFHHIKVIFRGDRKEDGIKCYAAAIFALHKRQHSAPIGVKKAAYSLALAVILLLVDLFSFLFFLLLLRDSLVFFSVSLGYLRKDLFLLIVLGIYLA